MMSEGDNKINETLKGVSKTLNSLFNDLGNEFSSLKKQLNKEELDVFNRNMKRIKPLAKEGKIDEAINLLKSIK